MCWLSPAAKRVRVEISDYEGANGMFQKDWQATRGVGQMIPQWALFRDNSYLEALKTRIPARNRTPAKQIQSGIKIAVVLTLRSPGNQ